MASVRIVGTKACKAPNSRNSSCRCKGGNNTPRHAWNRPLSRSCVCCFPSIGLSPIQRRKRFRLPSARPLPLHQFPKGVQRHRNVGDDGLFRPTVFAFRLSLQKNETHPLPTFLLLFCLISCILTTVQLSQETIARMIVFN